MLICASVHVYNPNDVNKICAKACNIVGNNLSLGKILYLTNRNTILICQ